LLIGVLLIVVLIILALPDDVRIVRRAGRVYQRWRGLLWEYRAGPHERQLRLPGVRRLQRVLLRGMQALWRQRQSELVRWLWTLVSRWLGGSLH
jgi:hypothetical protein